MMMILDVAHTIKSIYDIANAIYKVVQGVKFNHRQCQRLSGRIKVIIEAIAQLDQYPDSTAFSNAVCNLEKTLKEAHEFILKFTQQKTWIYQALKVNSNTQEFARFNKELQQAIADLHLTISAKQITNQAQDIQDQQADREEIKQLQNEIIGHFRQNQQEWKKFTGTVKDRDSLMLQQLQSVQWQLKKMQSRAVESKSIIPPEDEIPFFELSLHKMIGQGSIATVYSGEWAGQQVAIKSLLTPLSGNEGLEFIREIRILKSLHSPLIGSFYGACLEDNHACLVLEYLPFGSLYDYLPKNQLMVFQCQCVISRERIPVEFLRGKRTMVIVLLKRKSTMASKAM